MDESWLVLDIETVFEGSETGQGQGGGAKAHEGRAAAGDDPAGAPAAKREDPFAVLVKHRIVSIGVLWLDADLRFKKLGTLGEGKRERDFLADLHAFMDKQRPNLVTFNGRRFDVPVILLRSLAHGLTMQWYFASKDYRTRYEPNRHMDLCDVLSDHGAGRYPSLDDLAGAVGLPGKLGGMHGGEVASVWKSGDEARVHTYCLMDVIQTGFILMRSRLLSGRIDPAGYREAASSLRDAVEMDSRFAELVEATRWEDVVLTSPLLP